MIAVIGATGFTGERVVPHLCKQHPNEEIVAIVRSGSRQELLANERVSFRTAELADLGALQRALTGAGLVVSMISLALGHTPNLLAALVATKPDQVIFFSTRSVFSTVRTNTRDALIEAERLIADSGLPATLFRPTMVYGRPGDRNIERLLRFLRHSPFMPVLGAGTGLQQPVHVDDLAIAVGQASATRETIGRSYNLPGPRPMRFIELIRSAAVAVGRRPILIHVPLWLAYPTVRAWSTTGLWPRIRPDQLLRLGENKQADVDGAMRDFGYSPREFAQGVAEEAALLGLARPGIARG
jgi:nucleoside-diphosphate-sugar epimerase